MDILENPFRGTGLTGTDLDAAPNPSIDADRPAALMRRCFGGDETPLVPCEAFGTQLWVKDERGRNGLGSFKALGAAYVVASHAAETGAAEFDGALAGRTYVSATAGNHGLSVAAGAMRFGAEAKIYIAEAVPESFAERLRELGATVVRGGDDYQASLDAAMAARDAHGWTLLSDTSWPEYLEIPHRLMEGYNVMAAETVAQMPEAPTHIFLQAGVGGLAGACAAYFRKAWGDAPQIIVVEPDRAPALHHSIEAGHSVVTEGPVSDMGRLDCKEPSLIALKGLARDADRFVLISEEEAFAVLPELEAHGLATSTSGAAGVAAVAQTTLPTDARVLCILSEGPA